MPKVPYIQFYLGDYIKDTRILPLNVRGAWMDLLLYMWENDPQGELILSIEDCARLMNCSLDEANSCIKFLKEKKIFSWEEKDEGKIRIISRKQKKMVELSKTRKETGSGGGNPKLGVNYNKPGYLYSMQRVSDGAIKIGISTNPHKRIYKIRAQYRGDEIILMNYLWVENMGDEEKKIHEKFKEKKKGEWFNLSQNEQKTLSILLKGNSYSPLNSPIGKSKENAEYEYDNEIDNDNRGNRIGGMRERKEGMQLIPQMQDLWIASFPLYTPDKELDFPALRSIADFIFKNAGIKNGYGNVDNEIKVLNTFQLIADQVNREKFWTNKPLASIAKNIQEFYNHIKNPTVNESKSKQQSNGQKFDDEKLKNGLARKYAEWQQNGS